MSPPTATSDERNPNSSGTYSNLSCESCRRRKIKCDRERPSCAICVKAQHNCCYREAPLKPGPKLGSTQRSRKRARTGTSELRITAAMVESGSSEEAPENESIHIGVYPRKADTANRSADTVQEGTSLHQRGPLGKEVGYNRGDGPVSPETSDSPKSHPVSMHDLSFIVHPSHEPASEENSDDDHQYLLTPDESSSGADQPFMLTRACNAMDISLETLNSLIDLYFSNMTSFSLFHQSNFRRKILAINSQPQLNALLASMFSFSSRFVKDDCDINQSSPDGRMLESMPKHMSKLCVRFLDEAFEECEDDKPSLCLLQAMTLSTFQQLIMGARGRAWRSLGTCIRVAYELNLHLIDTAKIQHEMPFIDNDADAWSLEEEKRRTWWAIWEMDTFASTVRRYPTGIDWSQNETRLPTDDNLWFRGEPQSSCFLDPNPINRWKVLQQCKSQSPKAWFIVVNSLMREAQQLSSPRAVYPFGSSIDRSKPKFKTAISFGRKSCEEISVSLGVLENALQCFSFALPKSLRYRDEHLQFPLNGTNPTLLMRNSSIYSIHIMIQLTKFMMYQHAVFGGGRREHCQASPSSAKDVQSPPGDHNGARIAEPDPEGLSRYIEAADAVLMIVSRGSEDHIKYVNPFLSSTIWLAAAVQLVYKFFAPPRTNRNLIESKCEVLRLNYTLFVDYWKSSINLQKNLESLENALERFHSHPNAIYGDGTRRIDATDLSRAGFGDLSAAMDPEVLNWPGLASNQTNDRWMNDSQSINIESQSYQQPLGFDQFATQIEAACLANEMPFGGVEGSFERFGFEIDMGSQIDMPNYLNGGFTGTHIG